VGLLACHLPETLVEPSALADTICSPQEWGPCQLKRLDSWHSAPEPWMEGTPAGPTSGWGILLSGFWEGKQGKLGGLPEGVEVCPLSKRCVLQSQ
jgi:hypothetical protein